MECLQKSILLLAVFSLLASCSTPKTYTNKTPEWNKQYIQYSFPEAYSNGPKYIGKNNRKPSETKFLKQMSYSEYKAVRTDNDEFKLVDREVRGQIPNPSEVIEKRFFDTFSGF